MTDELNAHGQPIIRAYNCKRLHDRTLDELLGLAKGMAADRIINQLEAEFLRKWLLKNNHLNATWPVNVINKRVNQMLCDGVLDGDEQKELLELLCSFSGQTPTERELENTPSTFCLDIPAPSIQFSGKIFCFSGNFDHGNKSYCAKEVIKLGGVVKDRVTQKTDYLVVGKKGNPQWVHTAYGNKIKEALKLQQNGYGVSIVSEQHWANHLPKMEID